MKKAVRTAIIATSAGILLTPIAFFMFIYIVFLIGSNVIYYRHRPSFVKQVDYVFSDDLGNTYFGIDRKCYKFRFDNNDKRNYDRAFGNGFNPPYCLTAVSNNDFIFVCMYQKNEKGCFIRILDKELNPIKEWYFDDSDRVIDIAEKNNMLYCIIYHDDNSIYSLLMVDPFNDTKEVLVEKIEKRSVYKDGDLIVCACGEIGVSKEKTRLIGDGWFGNISKPIIQDDKIIIKYDDNSFAFQNNYNVDVIYSNAFLIKDYLLFAAYDHIENKQCGASVGTCICQMGKSYLFSFDLISKELNLLSSYEPGTFLIDYDLETVAYYYNGGLYVNDIMHKSCELIEPGPLEKIKGQSSFSSGDEKKDLYVSYYNGEFYGL
ncbi:MAG: hypothetical protein IJR08_04810 [Bacilli bacterium]|nr:hypothetical protein [Bacilli bacterium]